MREGRGGLGSIYVVASGNGGSYKDNCNFDGYANSIFTVTIGRRNFWPTQLGLITLWFDREALWVRCNVVFISGAVDESGHMPYYAENCASMLAVTYSSGQSPLRNIVSLIN